MDYRIEKPGVDYRGLYGWGLAWGFKKSFLEAPYNHTPGPWVIRKSSCDDYTGAGDIEITKTSAGKASLFGRGW